MKFTMNIQGALVVDFTHWMSIYWIDLHGMRLVKCILNTSTLAWKLSKWYKWRKDYI